MTNGKFEIEVSDSLITVDISNIKLNKRIIGYMKEIFGDLLELKLTEEIVNKA